MYFFRLIRLPNLLIIAITELLTAYCITDPHSLSNLTHARFPLLILSTLCIAAAGYVINDYLDIKIDYINKPGRVVIGKEVSRRQAILIHLFLNLAGLGISVFLSLKIALIHLIAALLLWFYSELFKKQFLIGNLVISLLAAIVPIVVWLYIPNNRTGFVIAFSCFAFFLNLIREIIKDIEDRRGDERHNCKTLPIVLGIRTTKVVLVVLQTVLIIAVGVFAFRGNVDTGEHILRSWYMGIFILLPLIYMLLKLVQADTRLAFRRLSLMAKLIMVSGVISMLL